ncbi:WD40 repeat domain-containing protein [Oxynema sp. CENA135]|uniref:WD40 repeat domain-containing protein n=1 Tax=Oxynema sp. CENA135 TaxID=984206 RepID=UPI00190C842F|nr:WD40 repeat domain-containing protein [Oxynema sp. CENA135]MBK4730162.1 WD40 repeat domain-containing protein [Oxynema sp. CENA135]
MPNFPARRGNEPQSLNPFNLRHYGWLADWIFFRPSRFSAYLYDANPEVYRRRGWARVRGSFKVPAYRNLYGMGLVSTLFLLLSIASLLGFYTLSSAQGHNSSIETVAAISPQRAVSASAGNFQGAASIKVWNLETGGVEYTLDGHRNGIEGLAVTPDGTRLLSAGGDRRLRVWDLDRGELLHQLKPHDRWIETVAVTPDGTRGISGSADRTLKVWDLESGELIHTLKGHTGTVTTVAVLPENRALSGSTDGTLKLWDLRAGTELDTLEGHNAGVTVVRAIGDRAVSGSTDGTLKVWDLERATAVHTLTGHENEIRAIAAIGDGQAISASADRTLKIWNLNDGSLVHTLADHTGWVEDVMVTPDGTRAISAASDRTLKIWDVRQGTLLHTLIGHREWIRSIAITPDGTRVISGAGDRQPKVWDVRSGREIPLKTANRIAAIATVGFSISFVWVCLAAVLSSAIALAAATTSFGVAGTVILALAIAMTSAVVFTVVFVFADVLQVNPHFYQQFGELDLDADTVRLIYSLAIGTLASVTFNLVNRQALGVFAPFVFLMLLAAGIGVFEASILQNSQIITTKRLIAGVKIAWTVAITFNLSVLLGSVRAIFYPIDAIAWLRGRTQTHPVRRDESLVLPVPQSERYLYRALHRDERQGLREIAAVARNPFQRAIAQRVLYRYLHENSDPLHFLYRWLEDPELEAYAIAPVTASDWALIPSRRQLLLGELNGRLVECSGEWGNQLAERCVWFLTAWRRSRRQTPLTRFAGVLYELLDETHLQADRFPVLTPESNYNDLKKYYGGVEIAHSLNALTAFLGYQTLGELQTAAEWVALMAKEGLYERHDDAPDSFGVAEGTQTQPDSAVETLRERLVPTSGAVRPAVLDAIARLADIAALTRTATEASCESQLAVLARSTAALADLDAVVTAELIDPECTIVRKIIHQWQGAIARAIAQVNRNSSPV